jgi:hypothetical protein
VNTPKIGSRVGGNCFGGILRFHAELRREFEGGDWELVSFEVSGRWAHVGGEEGGQFVCFLCVLGDLFGCSPVDVWLG